MKFSPTRTDPRIAILSPDIPDIERTGPVPGPSATNLWEFHFIHYAATTKNGCLLSSFLLFVGVYYFNLIKILSRTEKSYPHREKTTPFPTRPVFLTPDRTDPRFKQNIAPWPESGRGCTVRSGNPRRSGMPRSSLSWIFLNVASIGFLIWIIIFIVSWFKEVLLSSSIPTVTKIQWIHDSVKKHW